MAEDLTSEDIDDVTEMHKVINKKTGEYSEYSFPLEEIKGRMMKKGLNLDDYEFEQLSPAQTQAQPQQPQQRESGTDWKKTALEFVAPLFTATWESTKEMVDEDAETWRKALGYGARAGAVIGDVGMTVLPIGKVATGAMKAFPKVAGALEKIGEATGKAGKYAKNALESGAEAAAYDSSVKIAEDAESYAPDPFAVAGSVALGGVLGGRADIAAAKAKEIANIAAQKEAKIAEQRMKKAESITAKEKESTEKKLQKVDNQLNDYGLKVHRLKIQRI